MNKESRHFLIALLAYFALGIALLPFFQHQINTDGISYLDIAHKYAHGNFSEAINGYWSPLFPIALVPFLMAGIPGLLAAKILGLLIGAGILYQTKTLAREMNVRSSLQTILPFILVPILLQWAMTIITPDMLVVLIILCCLNILTSRTNTNDRSRAILLGIICGIGYWAKAYLLPFFLIHFSVIKGFHFSRTSSTKEKRSIIKNYFIGLAVFGVLCAAWACLISIKYHSVTLGTSAAFNYNLAGPESRDYPMATIGP